LRLKNVKYPLLIAVLMTVFINTACVQNTEEVISSVLPVEESSVSESSENNDQGQNSSVEPAAETSTEIEDVPTPSEDATFDDDSQTIVDVFMPTPRPEMVATDPTTVVLAMGDIQLFEFFAFW